MGESLLSIWLTAVERQWRWLNRLATVGNTHEIFLSASVYHLSYLSTSMNNQHVIRRRRMHWWRIETKYIQQKEPEPAWMTAPPQKIAPGSIPRPCRHWNGRAGSCVRGDKCGSVMLNRASSLTRLRYSGLMNSNTPSSSNKHYYITPYRIIRTLQSFFALDADRYQHLATSYQPRECAPAEPIKSKIDHSAVEAESKPRKDPKVTATVWHTTAFYSRAYDHLDTPFPFSWHTHVCIHQCILLFSVR